MLNWLIRNIRYHINLLLAVLLLSSFSIQSLDLSDRLAEFVEITQLDMEIDVEEESEFDDVFFFDQFADIIETEASLRNVNFYNETDKLWSAPILEVPERPPLMRI